MRPLLVALLLSLCLACTSARSQAELRPPLEFVERVLGAGRDEKLPLLIAMHGLGDTPEEFVELFDGLDLRVRIIAPRAPDAYVVGTSWFPIDDRARAPKALVERAALVVRLIDFVTHTRPTLGRPIVTGFSQGGMLSFALAAYHPDRLQGALPIAGTLFDSLPPYRKAPKGFTVTAFHGRADTRIPYEGAERTVARLERAGTAASLEGFANVGHAISPAMLQRYAQALARELAKVR